MKKEKEYLILKIKNPLVVLKRINGIDILKFLVRVFVVDCLTVLASLVLLFILMAVYLFMEWWLYTPNWPNPISMISAGLIFVFIWIRTKKWFK